MAVYTNKFNVERGHMIRIALHDEHVPAATGVEPLTVAVGEYVMSIEDARELGETLVRMTARETMQ